MRQLKSFLFKTHMECICFEISLKGQKWVLFSIYRPPSQALDHFLDSLGKAVDHCNEKYEFFSLLGDFNAVDTDQQIHTFVNSYHLSNLVKALTCFKSDSPRCIDLLLTNRR